MGILEESIISGIIYDLVKNNVKITFESVFGDCTNKDLISKKDFDPIVSKLGQINNNLEEVKDILANSLSLINNLESKAYPTQFSKLIDKLIYQYSKGNKKWNIARLSDYLHFESPNELKKYYLSSEEPEFKFIESVAEKLYVNKDWLKYGEGEPFKGNDFYFKADDILNSEDESKVQKYLPVFTTYYPENDTVYSDPEYRYMTILRQFDDLRYDCTNKFVFYDSTGGSGRSQLLSIYKLFNKLKNFRVFDYDAYEVDNDTFEELVNGNIFGGSVLKNRKYNYMFDFLYISEEEIACNYTKYDKLFADSQKYIKYALENDLIFQKYV